MFKDTLLECLKNKMKKERQPLVSVQEIAAIRAKYSHKGSGRKRRGEVEDDSSSALSRTMRAVSQCFLTNA